MWLSSVCAIWSYWWSSAPGGLAPYKKVHCSVWRKISSININVGLRLCPSLTFDPTECWRWTVVSTLPVFGSCCCRSGVSPLWASPVTVPSPAGLPSWSRHFQSMPRTTRAPGTMYFITCERNSRRWRRRLASASFTALPADAETPVSLSPDSWAGIPARLAPKQLLTFLWLLILFWCAINDSCWYHDIRNIKYSLLMHQTWKQTLSVSLPIRSERLCQLPLVSRLSQRVCWWTRRHGEPGSRLTIYYLIRFVGHGAVIHHHITTTILPLSSFPTWDQ